MGLIRSCGTRRRFAAIAVALLCCAFSTAVLAEKRAFRIDAEDASVSLMEFGRQAGLQILFAFERVKGFKTHAVNGTYEPMDAIRLLIKDTGLRVTEREGGVLVVEPQSQNSKQTKTSATSATPQGTTPETADSNKDKRQTKEQLQEVVPTSHEKIPEILVEGSRTLNMDIRRTADDPQPYVIFDREQITQSGAASVEDFLKNRLTMNTVAGTNSQNPNSFAGNQSQINLRGLGTNQTLILIDGHRTSSVNNQGTPLQFDINGIPLAAIERIEVLPSTASAIYGGSATGGAVNIILRRDYSGAEVRLTYDSPFDAGGGVRTVNLSGGFNLEGGKTNILIAGSYSDGNGLTLGDRDFLQRGRAAILAHNGNNYQVFSAGSDSPPLGATPNILSADGSNLVLNNGTALNSPITYVPVGYAGASDGGSALVANAGKYNLGLANSAQYTAGRLTSLVTTPQIESVTATFRRQFSSRVQIFLEASASSNSADITQGAAVIRSSPFLLPAGAPTNPFLQAILVSVPTNSDATPSSFIDNNRRLTGGVIVKLPREWMSEASYTWDQSRASFQIGPDALTSAAVPAVTAGKLNILRDTNAFPVDFLPYLDLGSGFRSEMPFRSTLKDISLRFAGPIGVLLPAGAPQVATLLEHRDEELSDSSFGFPGLALFYPRRSQSIDSVYAEIRVPLVSKKNAVPAIHELELQISGRHDDYTTHGVTGLLLDAPQFGLNLADQPVVHSTNKIRSTDPLVALRYQPLQDVTLRASYGSGFLPPTVDQIVPDPVNAFGPGDASDPRRGNTTVSFSRITGGNPNLQPENSRSWSAGAILTPRVLPGLRLSVDYTNIHKTDNITSINDIATLEALGRVTRGPNLPGDQPGWAGPITFVDETLANLLKAQVQAYDVQFDYHWNTASAGLLDFFALATWETHYKTQAVAGSTLVENVGVGDFNPLKFKANIGATWTQRQWIVGWSARYFDSYWVNAAHTIDVNQGSDHVPSQVYHDVFATYRFDSGINAGTWSDHLLSGTEITLGVKNVFNKEPPFDANSNRGGLGFYYSHFGDPRVASYWLSIKKSFAR